MPYGISVHKSHYKPFWVINTDTRDVKGRHRSRIAAQRQLNLLNAIMHGWKPTGKKARK